jgi:hypothetical protein
LRNNTTTGRMVGMSDCRWRWEECALHASVILFVIVIDIIIIIIIIICIIIMHYNCSY